MKFDRDGFLKETGLRIRLLRRKSSLTQEQVAAQVGLSRVTICNIENGRQGVTLDAAWRLAIVLGGVRLDRLTPEPRREG